MYKYPKIQKIQNTNYGIYIKYKLNVFKTKFELFESLLVLVDEFCRINCHFEYRIRILCI